MTTVEEMYGELELSDDAFYKLIDRSLSPRDADMLYTKFGDFELATNSLVLDAGCRDAQHTCRLVERFGLQAIGVDLVNFNIREAHKSIARQKLADRVTAIQANLEELPLADSQFDAIWCRDVLNHLPNLQSGLSELARVLKKNGRLLIYQTFATDLLEPREAAWLYESLAIVGQNMSPAYLEACLLNSGFCIDEIDPVQSEWREKWEEDGRNHTSKQLLRIARMKRNREALIAQVGEKDYTVELADCHWGVYQMLGKLCPTVYLATKK